MRQQAVLLILILFSAMSAIASIPSPMKEVGAVPPAVATLQTSAIDDELVRNVIPTNMPATSDEDLVTTRIVDHSIQSILHGWLTKKTVIGKVVENIEKVTKPEIGFKSGSGPNPIEHKLEFQFEPAQQIANLRYTGFFDSNLVYTVPSDIFTVNTVKTLTTNTRVGLVYNTAIKKAVADKSGNIYYAIDF
jgi:hypothetical protein